MVACVWLAILAASACVALSDADIHASRICVDNRAGFVLSFEMWDTATNMLSRRSPHYASPGQACLDVLTIPYVQPGSPVVTVVYAQAGLSQSLPPVFFDPEAETADYSCSGTTFLFSCSLGGQALEARPGALIAAPASPGAEPVRARGVCVQNGGGFRMQFRLWDTMTNTVGELSGGFNRDSNLCLDSSSSVGASLDDPVALIASVQGGYPATFQSVLYSPEAASATFVCSGTTLDYDCVLLGFRRLSLI